MKQLNATFLIAVLLLAFAGSTCKKPKPQKPEKPVLQSLSAQEKDDLQKLQAESKQGIPMALNLSKPHHYRHFMRAVKGAGHTPENSPMFFSLLKKAKESHAKNPPKAKTLLATTDPSLQPVGSVIEIGQDLKTGTNFTTTGLTSVPSGTVKSTMSLQLYDNSTSTPIGSQASSTQYGQGEDFTLTANGTFPSTPQKGDKVLSNLTYFYQPHSGAPVYETVFMTKSVIVPQAPPSVTLPSQNTAHQSLPNINVCLSRAMGNLQDCDYGPYENPTANPNVQFPFVGSVTYMSNVKAPLKLCTGNPPPSDCNTDLQFFIWKDDGGGCQPSALGDLLSFFKVNGQTVSWNFADTNAGRAQFGKPCFEKTERMDLSFMIAVQTANGGLNKVPAFVTTQKSTRPYDTTQIKYLTFMWGCLLPGTKVKMADGSWKKIEDVRVGDKVTSDAKDRKLSVVHTHKGNENNPIYTITTANGKTVKMTAEHSLPLKNGKIVLARQLKEGDEVTTDTGVSKIKKIALSPKKYTGHVWNLTLGAKGESVNEKNATFIADGLLVGDNAMQNHWGAHYRKDHRDILQRLPKEWHTDYQNYKKRTEK
ncbi:MAG: Hint domain-containing protein [Spirochaetota bacterium]